MLLGETEVNDEHPAEFFAEHEIRRFYISMYKAAFVYFLDRSEHFDQYLNRNFEVVRLLKASTGLCEVDAEKIHHNEVLLTVLYEVIDRGSVL